MSSRWSGLGLATISHRGDWKPGLSPHRESFVDRCVDALRWSARSSSHRALGIGLRRGGSSNDGARHTTALNNVVAVVMFTGSTSGSLRLTSRRLSRLAMIVMVRNGPDRVGDWTAMRQRRSPAQETVSCNVRSSVDYGHPFGARTFRWCGREVTSSNLPHAAVMAALRASDFTARDYRPR